MRSFYSPLSISAPFYGYLKLLATRKGKESKQGCEIRESNSGPLAPRPRTNRLCHPCALTDCAILAPTSLLLCKHALTDNTKEKQWPVSRKSRKTFQARKAICESTNRLFWKADLSTCFQGNKKKNNFEV